MSVISGKEDVIRFTRTNALRGLAIEIVLDNGMALSSRGSGLQACRIQGILPEGRTTKKAGLRAAVKNMKNLYPDFEVPASVQKALDK